MQTSQKTIVVGQTKMQIYSSQKNFDWRKKKKKDQRKKPETSLGRRVKYFYLFMTASIAKQYPAKRIQ